MNPNYKEVCCFLWYFSGQHATWPSTLCMYICKVCGESYYNTLDPATSMRIHIRHEEYWFRIWRIFDALFPIVNVDADWSEDIEKWTSVYGCSEMIGGTLCVGLSYIKRSLLSLVLRLNKWTFSQASRKWIGFGNCPKALKISHAA